MDLHSITAEEVLEQANRIFAPFMLRFASPLSWFAVWRSKILSLHSPQCPWLIGTYHHSQ